MKTLKIILNIVLIASLATLVITFFMKNKLPEKSEIENELYQDPIQNSVDESDIKKKEGGISYTIQPLYSFKEWGLVVSVNDNEKWYSRFKDTDPLNSKDICVIWGINLENEDYRDAKFSSEEFVCFYYSSSQEASQNFSGLHLANNHLLPKNDEIYKTIKKAKVGDQIYFSGFLSTYTAMQADGQEWTRGTSITRDDTGNGACETVYVDEFEIIKIGNPLVVYLYNFAKYLSILLIIVLFGLMFVPETREPSSEVEMADPPRPQGQIPTKNVSVNKSKSAIVRKYEEGNKETKMEDLLPPKREE